MRKCWRANPAERPTFSELTSTLDRLLRSVAGYVELTMTLPAGQPGPEEANRETADQPDAGEGKSSLYFELIVHLVCYSLVVMVIHVNITQCHV